MTENSSGMKIAALVFFLLASLALSRSVLAAGEKLTVGWSAIAGSQAPLWITKEAGLFQKNGLDVTMIYIDGGSKAAQALMSGDVPIVQIGGSAPVVARLRGGDVGLIAGPANTPPYNPVGWPGNKKPG